MLKHTHRTSSPRTPSSVGVNEEGKSPGASALKRVSTEAWFITIIIHFMKTLETQQMLRWVANISGLVAAKG